MSEGGREGGQGGHRGRLGEALGSGSDEMETSGKGKQKVLWPHLAFGETTQCQHPLSPRGPTLESSPHSLSALHPHSCDDQTAKKLLTYCSHFSSADHARALGELEARVAMLVEQLGTQGCSGKTLGTPGEEVS